MAFRAVAYQRKLQDAGVDARVAQTHAEAMEEFVVSELVTNDHLDAKLAQLEAKLEIRFNQVESKLEARINQVEAKLDARIGQVDGRVSQLEASLRGEMRALEATLIRWMVGTVGVAFGLALAFFRLVR